MAFFAAEDEPSFEAYPMRISKRSSRAMDILIDSFVLRVGKVRMMEFDFNVDFRKNKPAELFTFVAFVSVTKHEYTNNALKTMNRRFKYKRDVLLFRVCKRTHQFLSVLEDETYYQILHVLRIDPPPCFYRTSS